MSKLPTTPNNLKQPSPDNHGLEKQKNGSADVDEQAGQVNRDADELAKSNAATSSHKSKKSADH